MDSPVIWPHYISCDKFPGHRRVTTPYPSETLSSRQAPNLRGHSFNQVGPPFPQRHTWPPKRSIPWSCSFPLQLLFHYIAKMNGFLWGQLKTQLCGSRHGGVTDKRGRDMFHKLLISWQKEVRAAGVFLITTQLHIQLPHCNSLFFVLSWSDRHKEMHLSVQHSIIHCRII